MTSLGSLIKCLIVKLCWDTAWLGRCKAPMFSPVISKCLITWGMYDVTVLYFLLLPQQQCIQNKCKTGCFYRKVMIQTLLFSAWICYIL